MTIEMDAFVQKIKPESTVLFFGSGASLPSHVPSATEIIQHLSRVFDQPAKSLGLADFTELLEYKFRDRQKIVREIQKLFNGKEPTGGIQNIPLYNWKAIFTTNYDELIEQAYFRQKKKLKVYSSNFDFTLDESENYAKLFKLHGTISKDTCLGDKSRLILSGNDYKDTKEFRDHLFAHFGVETITSNLVIIGYSLSDPDIVEITNKIIRLNEQSQTGRRVTLLMYTKDEDSALLYESRGFQVVFGGVDDFFSLLALKAPSPDIQDKNDGEHYGLSPILSPVTIDVNHELMHSKSNVSNMFNGWPASYADVRDGLTFERNISNDVVRKYEDNPSAFIAIILGVSGVGKTTSIRQMLCTLHEQGYSCWEHKDDHGLRSDEWAKLADDLKADNKKGVLFIDNAHSHLEQLNRLAEALAYKSNSSLKLIVATSFNNWMPRVKSAVLNKQAQEYKLSRLDRREVQNLITLVENNSLVRSLVDNDFAGFSSAEKRRRLVERCEKDMFVCMRNIFATESFDDIVLREYAELEEKYQSVYKLVAALEDIGVRVHRQLIIRLLNIPADVIGAILDGGLAGIVTEYTIDEKNHIYGWRGRHPVINEIITKYKFAEKGEEIALFDKVIDHISPSYAIEIRSIRELCNINKGISRISSMKEQNRLLRRMISIVPGERIPRHRLIRNLIEMNNFEQARTEIRLFENDFGYEGPVTRYTIKLMVARARKTKGIMISDRVAILQQARERASAAIARYPDNPHLFSVYCDVGYELFKWTKDITVFDGALAALKEAENRIGDPIITGMVRKYEQKISGISFDEDEMLNDDGDDEVAA